MSLFLLTFIGLYGGAHLYFYMKLTGAHRISPPMRPIVALLLACLTVVPIGVRAAERGGFPTLATAIAYPGYLWMALLFLFTVVSTACGIANLCAHLTGILRSRPRRPLPIRPRQQFWISVAIGLLCSSYGLYEAREIRTERQVITTPHLAQDRRVRVVQISDVHLGVLSGEGRTERIISAVMAAQPDILVSTGDLIDGILTHDGSLARRFRQIRPTMGAFAIPGNHEYYVGIDRAVSMMQEAGFRVLRGDYAVAGPILVAGADDVTAKRTGSFRELPPLPAGRFTLLLKHQPLIGDTPRFDLQLSGHVHKGQIFPFNLVTWIRFPIRCGLTRLEDGRRIYVSRGTGTWGPPIRFLAPPEITIFDLEPSR